MKPKTHKLRLAGSDCLPHHIKSLVVPCENRSRPRCRHSAIFSFKEHRAHTSGNFVSLCLEHFLQNVGVQALRQWYEAESERAARAERDLRLIKSEVQS